MNTDSTSTSAMSTDADARASGPADVFARMWETRPLRLPARRKVAGVCAGIAARYGIDVVLVRVMFIIAQVFGGIGIAIYLAGWLFLRVPGEQVSGGEALLGEGRSSMRPKYARLLLVFLVLAVAFSVGTIADTSGTTLVMAGLAALAWWALYQRMPEAPAPYRSAVHEEATGAGAATHPAGASGTAPSAGGASPEEDPDGTPVPKPPSWDPLGAAPFAWDLPEPPAPEPEPEPERRRGDRLYTRAVYLVAAVTGLVLGVLSAAGDLPALGATSIIAIVLAVLVAGLAIGLVRRTGFGLITGIVVLAVVLLVRTVLPIVAGPGNGVGRISVAPVSASDLHDEYSRAVGEIHLDLRGLQLTEDRTVRVRVGVGSARVQAPTGMGLEVRCAARMGDTSCAGSTPAADGRPTLTIDASTTLGSLSVTRG